MPIKCASLFPKDEVSRETDWRKNAFLDDYALFSKSVPFFPYKRFLQMKPIFHLVEIHAAGISFYHFNVKISEWGIVWKYKVYVLPFFQKRQRFNSKSGKKMNRVAFVKMAIVRGKVGNLYCHILHTMLGLFTECTTTQNVCKCIVTSDTYASSEYNRMPKIGGWLFLYAAN